MHAHHMGASGPHCQLQPSGAVLCCCAVALVLFQHASTRVIWAQISEAYDVLSDPQKRQVYDVYGEEGLKGGVPGGAPGGPTGPSGAGAYHFDSDMAEKIFQQFFGGGMGGMGMGMGGMGGMGMGGMGGGVGPRVVFGSHGGGGPGGGIFGMFGGGRGGGPGNGMFGDDMDVDMDQDHGPFGARTRGRSFSQSPHHKRAPAGPKIGRAHV